MTPSPRHAHRSGAISSSTIAAGRIRALTAARPITPTSPRCPSAWQPSPAEAPLIDAEKLFRQPGPRHDARAKDPGNPYIKNNLALLEDSVRASKAVRWRLIPLNQVRLYVVGATLLRGLSRLMM